MDSILAFERSKAARGNKQKVFDWDKAAKIIATSDAKRASAGLVEDWEWTGDEIFIDGHPAAEENTYVFLSSNWATPVLIIDGNTIECWRYTDEWDAETYWPESALKILEINKGK